MNKTTFFNNTIIASILIISTSTSMDLSDFEVALDFYLDNPTAQATNQIHTVYTHLNPADQAQVQRQLQNLGINLNLQVQAPPQPQASASSSSNSNSNNTHSSKEFNQFKNQLEKWEQMPTGDNFNLVLADIEKIQDPEEKVSAESLMQGLLYEHKADSAEFKAADRVYAQRLHQQLLVQKAHKEELKNKRLGLSVELETCAANDRACLERKEAAQKQNALLKQKELELKQKTQALITQAQTTQGNSQVSSDQLQLENQQLTAQLVQVTAQIASLEQEYKQIQAASKRQKR